MFERRLRFVAVLGGLFFLVLAGKLFHMQVVRADHWRDEARRLGYRTLTLAARRGTIYDRHGTPLAEDRLQWDLVVRFDHFDGSGWVCAECGRPAVMAGGKPPTRCPSCRGREFERRPDPDLDRLAALCGVPREELAAGFAEGRKKMEKQIEAEIDRKRKLGFRVVPEEEERRFAGWRWRVLKSVPPEAVREISVHADRWRGLDLEPCWRRVNTAGAAADLVGEMGPVYREEAEEYEKKGYDYTQIWHMQVGRSGIEEGFEEKLAAHEGKRQIYRDEDGESVVLPGEKPARDGADLRTSIDLGLQARVAKALETAAREHEAMYGAFVAMDPETGEVVAMASWAREKTPAAPYFWPLRRSTPGSTFKVVTAFAGLMAGTLDPDEVFECDGMWKGIGCHRSHGRIGLRDALRVSCNGYFAWEAERMGIRVLDDWANRLGFDAPTGVGIPGEDGGVVGDPEWKAPRSAANPEFYPPGWQTGDTRQIGFGQGYVAVTPLQVARLMAIVANGGRFVRPSLVYGGGKPGDRVVSPESLRLVRQGLEAVVTAGTADDTGLSRFRAAGKTGTADSGIGNMAWFAGYAPADSPRYAFACCLGGVRRYGAEAAGPVCVAFLEEALSR